MQLEAKSIQRVTDSKCMESQNNEYKTIKIPDNLQHRYRRTRQLFNSNRWHNFNKDIQTNNIKYEQTSDGIVYHNHNSDFVFPEDSFRSFMNSRPKNGQLNNRPFTDSQPKNSGWQGMVWQSPNKIQDWEHRDLSINSNRPEWITTTPIPSITTSRPDQRPNLCQRECHKTVTNEYNPICGSDRVTYTNPGKFRCATYCGKGNLYIYF